MYWYNIQHSEPEFGVPRTVREITFFCFFLVLFVVSVFQDYYEVYENALDSSLRPWPREIYHTSYVTMSDLKSIVLLQMNLNSENIQRKNKITK